MNSKTLNAKWRQKLHLEPPIGWLNDPNGLCWFQGNYHVYFQYAPDDINGGVKKSWGHYKSPDMIHWEFTGTVLVPDISEDRDGVYSGSAIAKDDTLHLFYTGNVKENGDYNYILSGRGANVIHVTTEDGHHMSEKKVVLRNSDYPDYCSCHVRDPKVWQENGTYYMILGARTRDDKGCVLFYSSHDLEAWEYEKTYDMPEMGYMWECPDCFMLDGHRYIGISPQGLTQGTERNQNIFSSGYFLNCHFNDSYNNSFEEWDYGFDFYAPQTFETPDGRRILIGWMGIGDSAYSNPTAALGWQHCLTIPRELSRLEDGTLLQNPMKEYDSLRGEKITIKGEQKVLLPFDLTAQVNGDFEIVINNDLTLRLQENMFYMEFNSQSMGYGRTVRRVRTEQCRDIRVIADMSSIEVYLDGGRYVMSTRFYPDDEHVLIKADGINAELYKMNGMEVRINGE